MHKSSTNPALHSPILIAMALSLGAAISLGVARFAYGLLLPAMRNDLGWSYFLAGAMNTGNALGYLIGALATPMIMRRYSAQVSLLVGAVLTSIFMLLSGFVLDAGILFLQRVLAGIASALIFIAGGVLTARLSAMHPSKSGLIIGLYYGGTGFGIVLSSLSVPMTLTYFMQRGADHAWQLAWWVLAVICMIATFVMALFAKYVDGTPSSKSSHARISVRYFAFALTGYFMFGVGYIGYMTFVIALLKERGMSMMAISVFYSALGLAVIASSWIWAGMLDRFKGGESLAILNSIAGIAIMLPVMTSAPGVIFVSGILFGAVFLSVVASTTAFVRHNLPQSAWSPGISMFTMVFAVGQIIGPTVVGWIADGDGGLNHGLMFSAAALTVGALLASQQRQLNYNSR